MAGHGTKEQVWWKRRHDAQELAIEYWQEQIDQMHEEATERAHKHPFKLVFDGGQMFTQETLDAVYAQGKKDACRTILMFLKNM